MYKSSRTNRFLQTVKENETDIIFICDTNGRITMANPVCLQVIGDHEENLIGTSFHLLFSADQQEDLYDILKQAEKAKARPVKTKADIKTLQGDYETYEFHLHSINISGILHGILFIGRKLKRGQRTRELHKPSRLLDREGFEYQLAQKLNRADRTPNHFSIVLIQINGLHKVKETLGKSGDMQAFEEIRKRLESVLPKQTWIARISTYTAAVLLEEMKERKEIKKVCEQIIETIQKSIYVSGQEFYPAAAIGVCCYPIAGNSPQQLLKNGRIALYYAKAGTHQNIVFHTDQMNMEMEKRADLERCLRRGVENNQFFLVYQPIIYSSTGQMKGCEALIRWRHPKWGIVSPMDFIPIAEETGLIQPLGRWVLNNACRQVKEWHKAGYSSISVFVNVSACQLNDSKFLDYVKEALKESGLKAQYLHLELTESIMLERSGELVTMLKELRTMGVRLSIDDFGTGFSSFSYLKDFPVHSLKIDRSFIQHLHGDSKDLAIVHAILSMGQRMGLQVVAEGVESNHQMSMLSGMGCDFVQGYFIQKPLEARRFSSWLKKRDKDSQRLH
ncbi:EAL domain-containing protein [Siminovitchia sediminis]|uniref:EAL domain-containing protein n=1 Tax=Siminovitchia sediminis TaxID=1274353 RepID=A0ABW4KL76_9BACI